MKTSIHLLRTSILIFVFLHALNCSFSQTKISSQTIQKTNQPSVVLKVYEGGCKGLKSLLVYNPYQVNFFFYDTSPYAVRWYQDGELVGQNAMLKNVCGQNFTVVITNWTTGWSTSINYFMGCGNQKYN